MVSGLHALERLQEGSRRAVEAGFDVIELHAAHGYIFSQFYLPSKTGGIDRYGGCLENRQRFLMEVYRDVYSEVAGSAWSLAG